MKAAERRKLGELLARATDAPNGGAYLSVPASALRAIGEALKGKKPGRPRGPEIDLPTIALEYHTRRARGGLSHAEAMRETLAPSDDPLFLHGDRSKVRVKGRLKNRWTSASFSRLMYDQRKIRPGDQADLLSVLDIIYEGTPDQYSALRQELDDRSKPKSKRTRK